MLISVVYLYSDNNKIKTNTMTSSEILLKGQKNLKPVYLITSKNELISEMNFMENNWDNSMTLRMLEISKQSIKLFNTPISKL